MLHPIPFMSGTPNYVFAKRPDNLVWDTDSNAFLTPMSINRASYVLGANEDDVGLGTWHFDRPSQMPNDAPLFVFVFDVSDNLLGSYYLPAPSTKIVNY